MRLLRRIAEWFDRLFWSRPIPPTTGDLVYSPTLGAFFHATGGRIYSSANGCAWYLAADHNTPTQGKFRHTGPGLRRKLDRKPRWERNRRARA